MLLLVKAMTAKDIVDIPLFVLHIMVSQGSKVVKASNQGGCWYSTEMSFLDERKLCYKENPQRKNRFAKEVAR